MKNVERLSWRDIDEIVRHYYLGKGQAVDTSWRLEVDKDEEYFPLLEDIQHNIVFFTALSEQDRLSYVREYLGRQNASGN